MEDSGWIGLADFAWGVIANAGGGDWSKESKTWQDAAARWRTQYEEMIAKERGITK